MLWKFITRKEGAPREDIDLDSESCCAVLPNVWSVTSISTAVPFCSILLRVGYQKSKERKTHDTSMTLKNIREWKILCPLFVAPTAVLTAAR